jgi:nucleoid-associated protein YgaU
VAILLTAGVVAGCWAGSVSSAFGRSQAPIIPVSQHRYVVRAGETLWSIAERVAPGEDPRVVVDRIVRVNRVDPGGLVPGQALVIPATG